MKKMTVWALLALVALAISAWAADFALPAPISVGSITAFQINSANYNLDDDSWMIEATPIITNRLSSSTNDVSLIGAQVTMKRVVIHVEKAEVYAMLDVQDFSNTLLIDFQNALIRVALAKVAGALAQPQ